MDAHKVKKKRTQNRALWNSTNNRSRI